MLRTQTPRLIAVAREFNVGVSTLIRYLVQKGYQKENLKVTGRITKEMYDLLQKGYQNKQFLTSEAQNKTTAPKKA